jgi:Meiotically up-regulated gene 113
VDEVTPYEAAVAAVNGYDAPLVAMYGPETAHWIVHGPDRPRRGGGHIYFVQMLVGGPIKIGWATSVASRVATLQLGCPYPLVVLATMAGTMSDERELHKRFADHRLRGEWFHEDAPGLRELVGACRAGDGAVEVDAPTEEVERWQAAADARDLSLSAWARQRLNEAAA